MAKLKVILLSTAFASVVPFGAQAGNFVELGGSKKASTIQNLGYTPKKNKSELKLGKLRTNNATLPNGKLTLSGRMKLRAERAVQRQNALSRTKKRPQPTSQPASGAGAQNFDRGSGPDRIME